MTAVERKYDELRDMAIVVISGQIKTDDDLKVFMERILEEGFSCADNSKEQAVFGLAIFGAAALLCTGGIGK